jgi:stage III sporulation protein SpoIIIAA
MTQIRITDDLEVILAVLPPQIQTALREIGRVEELIEVILDLGRVPTARYTDGEIILSEDEVTRAEVDHVVARIGEFDADNRAGIPRTLHRISAIRNRRGHIVGLTCRVGRAVYGTIDVIQDIVESGKSIILLGRPGVGKTTMLREAARVLAETKRVVIVDTSNEIGGDGDISHPAVGRARRMQVAMPSLQHEVMIEAVENHNPEVIVIDEIGRELEAVAARTIAERGVQLIGTAHGVTLDNLLLNPTLSDLVGGIESVTLSDEEARRRGTQKTVLERRAPPTFDVLIEIQDRQRLAVHHDVASAVDSYLRGRPLAAEVRTVDESGQVHIEEALTMAPTLIPDRDQRGIRQVRSAAGGREDRRASRRAETPAWQAAEEENGAEGALDRTGMMIPFAAAPAVKRLRLYAYGIARNRLEQSARRLRLPVDIVDDLDEANVVVTLKNYWRRRPRLLSDAEQRGLPIHVLRANTMAQMEQFLTDVFNVEVEVDQEADPFAQAMRETEEAIQKVQAGARSVDLTPQNAFIRRRQHQMAREANLISHSYGKEPRRRVRIYRD